MRRQLVETFDPDKAGELGRAIAHAGVAIVPTLIWSNSFRPLSATDDGARGAAGVRAGPTRERWQQARANYLKAAGPDDYAANAAVAAVGARAVGAIHAAGARVLAGTDTLDYFVLPGSSLHSELALLVGAGLTPLEALQSATRDAAEFRGTLAREGTIERGKRADLVLLDADPLRDIRNVSRIATVLQGGRILSRADLDALLARAKP